MNTPRAACGDSRVLSDLRQCSGSEIRMGLRLAGSGGFGGLRKWWGGSDSRLVTKPQTVGWWAAAGTMATIVHVALERPLCPSWGQPRGRLVHVSESGVAGAEAARGEGG